MNSTRETKNQLGIRGERKAMKNKPTFQIIIRDIDGEEGEALAPPINRLKIILKSLLRAHGYRCERIEDITQNKSNLEDN